MENKEIMLIMGSTKSNNHRVAEGPSMRAETMLLGVQAPVVGVMAGVGVTPPTKHLPAVSHGKKAACDAV